MTSSNGRRSLSPSRTKAMLPLPAGVLAKQPMLDRLRMYFQRRTFTVSVVIIVAILLIGTIAIPLMAVDQLGSGAVDTDLGFPKLTDKLLPGRPLPPAKGEKIKDPRKPAPGSKLPPVNAGDVIAPHVGGVISEEEHDAIDVASKVDDAADKPSVDTPGHNMPPARDTDEHDEVVQEARKKHLPADDVKTDAQQTPEVTTDDTQAKPNTNSNSDHSQQIDDKFNINTVKGKQQAVKQAFVHSWSSYSKNCFGSDEIFPIRGQCNDWLNQAATLIDSLGTLWLMGMRSEFDRAVNFVSEKFKPEDGNRQISFFETVIRCLGGLLSAYDMTLQASQGNTALGFGDDTLTSAPAVKIQPQRVLLEKAQSLADRLLPAFDTQTGLARSQINLAMKQAGDYTWTSGNSLLAEIGTVQLEFGYLARATGDWETYGRKPFDAYVHMHEKVKADPPGLFPYYINPNSGQLGNNIITFGAMGDSYFEYVLKTWLITGKTHSVYKEMYLEIADSLIKHVYTEAGDRAWLADLQNGQKQHKMDHLACFVPGMIALGVAHGVTDGLQWTQPDGTLVPLSVKHMEVATKLTATCNDFYTTTPTGLSPEFMRFDPSNGNMDVGEASYKLRPEVLESIFIMFRLTGDQKYRDWGWSIFQSIEKQTKAANGYTQLRDVRQPGSYDDRMESFFFAETLKYLYLLFDESESLVQLVGTGEAGTYQVFNTECHPMTSWSEDSSPYSHGSQTSISQQLSKTISDTKDKVVDKAAVAVEKVKEVAVSADQIVKNMRERMKANAEKAKSAAAAAGVSVAQLKDAIEDDPALINQALQRKNR